MNNQSNIKQLSKEDALQVSGGGANPPPFIDTPDIPDEVCILQNGVRICFRIPPTR